MGRHASKEFRAVFELNTERRTMDNDRVDEIAKALGRGTSRRRALARLSGLAAGSLLPLVRSSVVSANHKRKHCANLGKHCHAHKECCGICGAEGFCQSCDGVVSWAGANLTRLAETGDHADNALLAIREISAGETFNAGLLGPVVDAEAAIRHFSTEISTGVTPPVAEDPLRTLLEMLAEMIDALSDYLDQVSEEAYIETGERASLAITEIAAGIPPLEVEIAVLRDACDD
jgi:hypothetical protein